MTKWVKHGNKATRVKADGEVRRSQAVRTYGAGSLLDLLDRTALVGGLDFWRFGTEGSTVVQEPRLYDKISARLQALDEPINLSPDRPFLLPPAGIDGEPQRNCGVEVFEFPRWFVCQGCRALSAAPQGVEFKAERWQHRCDTGKYNPAVPVRFVMACRNGHLDEVPWMYFVHEGQKKPLCDVRRLQLIEGKTGDFSEVMVRCACGLSRALANAATPEANPPCRGQRPWLGPEAKEDCVDGQPRLLMRGASNGYFAQVESALSIPESSSELVAIVRGLMDVLTNATEQDVPMLRKVVPKLTALGDSTAAEVFDAICQVKNPSAKARQPLRTAEFLEFVSQPKFHAGALPPPGSKFFARRYTPPAGVPAGIKSIVLAPRLREVSVQVGFTRLEPPTSDLQGEYDLGVGHSPLGLNTDWLPAAETWGEGVFLQLDEKAVHKWENKPEVLERTKLLRLAHEEWERGRKVSMPFPGARFYLLHSLSHLLLNAIAVECGYSAAALSERIYCAPHSDAEPLAAILISTGTPGTEGTLGGLVEQGKHIVEHLQRAFDMGRLCSNDPVCAFHNPVKDPTGRQREGAACHGCMYVAEPSCERFNAYLDRALVVPVMGQPAGLAFFGERPSVAARE